MKKWTLKMKKMNSALSISPNQEQFVFVKTQAKHFSCGKCKCDFSDESNLEYHISIHNSKKKHSTMKFVDLYFQMTIILKNVMRHYRKTQPV